MPSWSSPMVRLGFTAAAVLPSACSNACLDLCASWYDYQAEVCDDPNAAETRALCESDYRSLDEVASDADDTAATTPAAQLEAACTTATTDLELLLAAGDDRCCYGSQTWLDRGCTLGDVVAARVGAPGAGVRTGARVHPAPGLARVPRHWR